MKKIFALIFLLNLNFSFGQKYQVEDVKVYKWDVAKNADPDTVFGISFAKMKLTSLPSELSQYTFIKVLDLSKNKLVELPKFIEDFPFLEDLDLEKNKLIYFPVRICKDTSIRFLRMGKNLFETMPNSIDNLRNLEYIDLYDTPISSLPETIVNLSQLKEIDFTGIRFSERFQNIWLERLEGVNVIFDSPCDCFD